MGPARRRCRPTFGDDRLIGLTDETVQRNSMQHSGAGISVPAIRFSAVDHG